MKQYFLNEEWCLCVSHIIKYNIRNSSWCLWEYAQVFSLHNCLCPLSLVIKRADVAGVCEGYKNEDLIPLAVFAWVNLLL